MFHAPTEQIVELDYVNEIIHPTNRWSALIKNRNIIIHNENINMYALKHAKTLTNHIDGCELHVSRVELYELGCRHSEMTQVITDIVNGVGDRFMGYKVVFVVGGPTGFAISIPK